MGEVAVDQSNGDTKNEKDATSDDILNDRIISQLEYYFSDVNLSRDRFMQQQIREDEGWLPIELLLKFKRLAAILGDKDKSVIVQAVKAASNMLEINGDEDKIRRSAEHPLPDEYDELRKTLMTRTVYVKGFPLENITFDELFQFFKTFGKIDSVIMRHYTDRATKKRGFKGSAFVTFPTVEDADAFLQRDDVKYKDTDLIKKWQSTYIEDKRKERLDDKLKLQQRRRENKRSNKGEETTEGKEGEEKEEEKFGFPLDAVVHFTGLSETSTIHRDQIREAIESLELSVAFIDFGPGDTSGFVRLDRAKSATQLIEKLSEGGGKLKVAQEELELRKLEGEEESNYLDRARKEMNKRRQNNKSKRRRGGRGGHFNDRGRKRKGGAVDGAPAAKTPAVE